MSERIGSAARIVLTARLVWISNIVPVPRQMVYRPQMTHGVGEGAGAKYVSRDLQECDICLIQVCEVKHANRIGMYTRAFVIFPLV